MYVHRYMYKCMRASAMHVLLWNGHFLKDIQSTPWWMLLHTQLTLHSIYMEIKDKIPAAVPLFSNAIGLPAAKTQ